MSDNNHEITYKEDSEIRTEVIGYFSTAEKAVEFFNYLRPDREIISVEQVSSQYMIDNRKLGMMPSRLDRAPQPNARWTP